MPLHALTVIPRGAPTSSQLAGYFARRSGPARSRDIARRLATPHRLVVAELVRFARSGHVRLVADEQLGECWVWIDAALPAEVVARYERREAIGRAAAAGVRG